MFFLSKDFSFRFVLEEKTSHQRQVFFPWQPAKTPTWLAFWATLGGRRSSITSHMCKIPSLQLAAMTPKTLESRRPFEKPERQPYMVSFWPPLLQGQGCCEL